MLLRPGHTKPMLAVDGRQADDERGHALLRLVCPAPSCLFSRADAFSAENPRIQHVKSVGSRPKAVGKINPSDWLFS